MLRTQNGFQSTSTPPQCAAASLKSLKNRDEKLTAAATSIETKIHIVGTEHEQLLLKTNSHDCERRPGHDCERRPP